MHESISCANTGLSAATSSTIERSFVVQMGKSLLSHQRKKNLEYFNMEGLVPEYIPTTQTCTFNGRSGHCGPPWVMLSSDCCMQVVLRE